MRRLCCSDSRDKEFLIVCVGDPGNPNKLTLGSAGDKIIDARPPEEWTKVRSRRTHLNGNIFERHGGTLHCLGCESRGHHSNERRQFFEEMIIDVDEAFDTSATKRIHDLGDSKEGEIDKLDSKKSPTDDQGLDITNLRCERHVV